MDHSQANSPAKETPPTAQSSRPQYLLIIGAIIGLLLAASGLLDDQPDLATMAVATVNDQIISKEDYLDYLSLLANDKRNPLTENDRRHVLNRMIEEKLLVERGVDIGLTDSDPTIRKAITNAMIQTIITDVASTEPSNEELTAFYQKNKNYFAKPARIQLQRVIFRADDKSIARANAQAASKRLQQGESFQQVKNQLGSNEILKIPNTLLPPNKLRQYIGPQLTLAALIMAAGEISEPIEDNAGYSILWVIRNEKTAPLPLEQVRDLVSNEYNRRAGDKALQDYLVRLRQQADIITDEDFLNSLNTISDAGQ